MWKWDIRHIFSIYYFINYIFIANIDTFIWYKNLSGEIMGSYINEYEKIMISECSLECSGKESSYEHYRKIIKTLGHNWIN